MARRTAIKICGITNKDDALACALAGADELGFNFFAASPRYIEPAAVGEIIKSLPREVAKVGVFVNESVRAILRIAAQASLDAIQLHGDEPDDFVSELRSKSDLKIIKALRIAPHFSFEILPADEADAYLLDSYSGGSYGGTGATFDWSIAERAKRAGKPLYLAGGLNEINIREAVLQVRPYAVDACSGLESQKGRKGHEKVKAFIMGVKEADGI